MRIGGGVFRRCAGAALLAGLFLAAITACGQTPRVIQSTENYSENEAPATDPSALSPQRTADVGFDTDSAAPPDTFASEEASCLSDSGHAELPSAPAPAAPVEQSEPYTPIKPHERLVWVVKTTLWPQHLMFGAIRTGIATAQDAPPEDGPHWGGFAERFGIRLTGVATSKVMEASVGSLWGEDPRYFRVPEESFGARVKNVIRMTFLARRSDGRIAPAYARYIAFSGSNFLSNTWRPDSDADTGDAVRRTFEAFAGHMAGNAWNEFWPDAKRCIFHRCKQP